MQRCCGPNVMDTLITALPKLLTRWPDLQRGVAKALRDIRELGVCCSFGEWQKDVNAIALPVKPGGGLPPMAISCGAPAYMVCKEFLLEKVRPRLIALANELETSLGTAG